MTCPAPVQSTGLLPASPPPPAPAAALVAPPPAAALERPDQAARASQPDEVEPLTAELRRLHVTVSRRFLSKLDAAHDGLSHALPSATTEQVLEAALDLLLERQASRRGLVKRPSRPSPTGAREAAQPVSAAVSTGAPGPGAGSASEVPGAASRAPGNERTATPAATQASTPASTPAAPPASRHIPAAVRREVWLRDGQRCQHPLDAGGTCGSTLRLELDHLVPLALGGPSTADNLQVTCAAHNRAAARATLGEALAASGRGRAGRGSRGDGRRR
ncbi:MAG: HNH endonuclease [Anaeromyxobacter sp.]|nr:HNH endonuclease [Anaeromyxobacter sp.]